MQSREMDENTCLFFLKKRKMLKMLSLDHQLHRNPSLFTCLFFSNKKIKKVIKATSE